MTRKIFWFIGRFFHVILSYSLFCKLIAIKNIIYSGYLYKQFKSLGENVLFSPHLTLVGGKYITIGENTKFGRDVELTAHDVYGKQTFTPEIVIGKFVSINSDCHLTAINKIIIGDYVRMGRRVLITDNAHGRSDLDSMSKHPINRDVFSLGEVVIEDDVWIGNNVSILPNVRIGKGAIIGTNAVVTKNVPPFGIAVGNPAKVVKIVTE